MARWKRFGSRSMEGGAPPSLSALIRRQPRPRVRGRGGDGSASCRPVFTLSPNRWWCDFLRLRVRGSTPWPRALSRWCAFPRGGAAWAHCFGKGRLWRRNSDGRASLGAAGKTSFRDWWLWWGPVLVCGTLTWLGPTTYLGCEVFISGNGRGDRSFEPHPRGFFVVITSCHPSEGLFIGEDSYLFVVCVNGAIRFIKCHPCLDIADDSRDWRHGKGIM